MAPNIQFEYFIIYIMHGINSRKIILRLKKKK
jgi:hypothetical protein